MTHRPLPPSVMAGEGQPSITSFSMVNDSTFGPIMMVGFGGTMVELMGDIVHRPAPIDTAETLRMLGALRAAPLMRVFRSAPAPDPDPLATLIARISDIILLHRDRIREMEFNPVILHADGSGITIADALIMLNED